MPGFKVITNRNEIIVNKRWIPVENYENKNKFVDEKGQPYGVDSKGNRYRLIDKRERQYSCLERFGRGCLGTLAVISIIGVVFFTKAVKELFTKPTEKVRFGILENPPSIPTENLLPFGSPVVISQENLSAEANIPQAEESIDLAVVEDNEDVEENNSPIEQQALSLTPVRINQNDDTKRIYDAEGRLIYQNAEILYKGMNFFNLAVIKTNGEKTLVPVASCAFGNEFTPCKESTFEIVLKYAQEIQHVFFTKDCIKTFVNHPANTEAEKFFSFILGKDENGTPRICTLNPESANEILQIFKEKNIVINLHEKMPTGETLFTLWAGKGRTYLTRTMLELDPSIIEQLKGREESVFVEALLNRSSEEADLLLNAMIQRKVVLSSQEKWILKAYKNFCIFSEEEFLKLDQEAKERIYYIANAYSNTDFVKKMHSLGMVSAPVFRPGPAILAHNMDLITAENVMGDFLKGLRNEGLLLTEKEFEPIKDGYMQKSSLGRILGKNFTERVIKENGLKHIKVPKKVAVIPDSLEKISCRIIDALEIEAAELIVYAKLIQSSSRTLSLEEGIEFMIALEKTGYSDFIGKNFIVAADGIYFIDTEYHNFIPLEPRFGQIEATILELLDPNDIEAFKGELAKRKEAYEAENEFRFNQQQDYQAAFKSHYARLAKGYGGKKFEFSRGDLLIN